MPRHVPDAHHFCFAVRINAQIVRHAHLRYSSYALKTVLAPLLSLLRHSRIESALDLYTQGDGDETRAAQGAFLREMGLASELVQLNVGRIVGWPVCRILSKL